MSLSPVVELYRACNKPPLEQGDFVCTTEFSQVKEILKRIKQREDARFDRLIVDGVDVLDEDLPENGKRIEFFLRLPSGSSNTFHSNLNELLETEPRISRGYLPDDFYLVEEDYYSADPTKPVNIDALERVCRLIRSLSQLALYHDEKPSGHYLRLVFVQPADGTNGGPIVLETRVTGTILENTADLDPRLVEGLSESSASNDPHYSAKVGVFGASLANFVSSRLPKTSAFYHLVANWQQFVDLYQRDLSTYLSGFAFHKAKREVAEEELKIAGEFSKVLSEITGKILSIPVSFVAVLAILRAETLPERLVLLLGVLIASVVIFRLVENQRRQLDRIKHAKNLVLGAIEGRKEVYPKDLLAAIEGMICNLNKSEVSLYNCLAFFAWLSWLPVFAAAVALSFLYFAEIRSAIFRFLCL
jgi:hypothetical protein